jgi:hypothetical protein
MVSARLDRGGEDVEEFKPLLSSHGKLRLVKSTNRLETIQNLKQ